MGHMSLLIVVITLVVIAAVRIKMITQEWNLNIDFWPGPDRMKWPGMRDIIQESPDGRYVAVLYSCGEKPFFESC